MSGRFARVPLRTQLTGLLLISIAVVVVATGLAGTVALRTYLVDRIDGQLVASVQESRRELAGRGGFREPRGPRQDVAVTMLQYDAGGQLPAGVAARLAVVGGPRITDPFELPTSPTEVGDVREDRRWRVLAEPRGDGVVVAAVALDGVQDTASQLLVINAAVGLVALAGGGVLAWVAVRRSLRPLVTVERAAEAIAAGDLSVRVPSPPPGTEVGSLATSFNAMVDQFEAAYGAQQRSEAQARASEDRMRRFVADASHELRTPLTSIRGFAELFRQGAVTEPDQLAQVMRRIEDEAARMGLLVEDLLLLARLDAARPLQQRPVDLLQVASEVVQAAAAAHGAHHVIRMHPLEGASAPVVIGDDARLHQVLGNLVANAVAHTPPGTTVDISVQAANGAATLQVRDDGPGMTEQVAARVFERFYRADGSRTRTGSAATGNGLGLSIVAALV
ncbi:MAG: HAMP domain-containing histidine kinase, partial [Frankiales bacterium]|nr:HAMP domain-containing histidine kinase [Frankiales bacterium]